MRKVFWGSLGTIMFGLCQCPDAGKIFFAIYVAPIFYFFCVINFFFWHAGPRLKFRICVASNHLLKEMKIMTVSV